MSFERNSARAALTKSLLPQATNLQNPSAQLVNAVNAPCPKLERPFRKHPCCVSESLPNQIPRQKNEDPLLPLFGASWMYGVGYSQQHNASVRI